MQAFPPLFPLESVVYIVVSGTYSTKLVRALLCLTPFCDFSSSILKAGPFLNEHRRISWFVSFLTGSFCLPTFPYSSFPMVLAWLSPRSFLKMPIYFTFSSFQTGWCIFLVCAPNTFLRFLCISHIPAQYFKISWTSPPCAASFDHSHPLSWRYMSPLAFFSQCGSL